MKESPASPEGRQHLNLSQYAYDIIRSDSLNFLRALNISGFINTVIENSMVESFDDLSLMEEERLIAELSAFSPTKSKSVSDSELKTIKKIAEAHRFHTIKSSQEYPKDKTLKIRLQNKLHDELYPEKSEWEGRKYSITQGEYIKSIIEEYARKTYFERECIFFKNLIEDINKYVSASDTEKRILSITMKNGRKSYCKPYRLSEEYETNYHYLIGLFADEGSSEYKIASVRLSRIAGIRPRGRSLGSGKITQSETKNIENKIKVSGIPYLIGDPETFVIKLTNLGMTLYDYIYAQRPIYDSLIDNQDGTYTLIIKATERQIQNYFFAFGKEALIQSTDKTNNWMKQKYTEASKAYGS